MGDDRISMGMGAAWGFSGADLTSPATAGRAGALPDTLPAPVGDDDSARRWRVTELRVHGVSGSDGPTMLEHPDAVQVAGDSVTRFYRRWTPAGRGGNAVPWKLEAYSWGGLTEAPLAAAAWILLTPFMLVNLAHFMLPRTKNRQVQPGSGGVPERLSRDRWHIIATALLRLLAVTATAQFTAALVAVLINGLAYQGQQAHIPSWLRAFTQLPADVRIALATVAVCALIAALWWVSVATANRYEARVSSANRTLNAECPLTQPTFWCGQELVRRQRSLHAAAALAVTALFVARPTSNVTGLRLAVAVAAGGVLASVLVSLCLPLADRHAVVLGREPTAHVHRQASPVRRLSARPAAAARTAGTFWCQLLLAAAVVVVATSLFTGGWTDPKQPVRRTIAGFVGVSVTLLVLQAVLLVALSLVVWRCARLARPAHADRDLDPFLNGHLTTVIAALAVVLGGLLSGLSVLFVTRLVGVPEPSGLRLKDVPAHALEVPWPLYAFTAAPFGLVLAGLGAACWLVTGWRADVRLFTTPDGNPRITLVDSYYRMTQVDPAGRSFAGSRLRVARAWATARLTDRAPGVALLLTCGSLAAMVAAEVYAGLFNGNVSPLVHGVASAESTVGLFVAGLLVTLLRTAYRDPSKRKTIGALWDVGTFWPRAAHPFAPPCYAERAIPELVDRVRVLTGTVATDANDPAWLSIQAHQPDSDRASMLDVAPGPLLLTGYSQGSVMAPAVIAQLPKDTAAKVALLTLACPARRLYGRAFPAYFGPQELASLTSRLTPRAPGETEPPAVWPESWRTVRWRNLVRETDYIGSWVQTSVPKNASSSTLNSHLDQPCADPPTITADRYPTPPPIHRHSDFWQDPCTTKLGEHLVDLLLAAVPSTEDSRSTTTPARRSGTHPRRRPTSDVAASVARLRSLCTYLWPWDLSDTGG